MKYFKTEASRASKRHIITAESFERVTERKFPFEQSNSKGKFSQYGICPSCLNPIQLIGISHEVKVSSHGKHTGKTIEGFPEWKQMKYKYCPYAKNGAYVAPDNDTLLPTIDKDVIALYDMLLHEFDRVVYVIEKDFDFRGSKNFWKKALQRYIENKVYCYPWLTESNLPYIFALRGIHQINCIRQKFRIDSDPYKALSLLPDIIWEESEKPDYYYLSNKPGKYINLIFRLTNHKQKAIDGNALIESLEYCIDDKNTMKTIFKKKIEFDETFFTNLIQNKSSTYRREDLLKITEQMPRLQMTH
ncbi:MAG: hypothetical protein IK093_00745 [Ruminiclostridium sp.]|nr:hypothetical protein [Ruminiclostridium sp.]